MSWNCVMCGRVIMDEGDGNNRCSFREGCEAYAKEKEDAASEVKVKKKRVRKKKDELQV